MTPFAKAAMSIVVWVNGPHRRAWRPPIVIGARRRAMRAGGARYAAIATPIESITRIFAARTAAGGKSSKRSPKAKSMMRPSRASISVMLLSRRMRWHLRERLLGERRSGHQVLTAGRRIDKLEAERQSVRPCCDGHRHRAGVQQRPQPVEDRTAGRCEPDRRLARRRRTDQNFAGEGRQLRFRARRDRMRGCEFVAADPHAALDEGAQALAQVRAPAGVER